MELYKECVAQNIPIMCHGTSGGMYTHERAKYWDLAQADAQNSSSPTSATSKQFCLEAKQKYFEYIDDEDDSDCEWHNDIDDVSDDLK